MPRPEATTGSAAGTAFYDDGSTPLNDGVATAQIVTKTDGSVCGESTILNGNFKFGANPSGDYVINIIVNGLVVGSIEITITAGVDLEGQNVTTNRV